MTVPHTHSMTRTTLRGYSGTLLSVSFLCALSASGRVAAADVADFAIGEHNICIVDTAGRLECNSNSNSRMIPADTGNTYIKVSSGGQHSCAITTAGEIECWGEANFGALNTPVSNFPFVDISSSEAHSCALDASGQVACWGLNSNGQTDVPDDNADFVAIETGTSGSCGIKSSGLAVCWSNSWPFTWIDAREDVIDIQLPQRENGDTACTVNEQGDVGCAATYGSVAPLDDGPYTKASSNAVMLCGLKTNGDMDCNLRDRTFVQTQSNIDLLASIEALPALIDFDTRYEYDYHMSFCGVDVNQQLHCLGDSLPADFLPGEPENLPVPTALSLNIYGSNVAELLWSADLSQIEGAPGQFRVYRNGEMVNQSYANASYLDRDFEEGVSYVYQVAYIAPDGMEGELSEPLSVNGEFSNPGGDGVVSPPNAAITLNDVVVSRYGEGSLELFWSRPAQPTRQYDIYRNGELLTSTPGPSYFDNQINATNAYQYTIVAIGSDGSILATGFAQAASLDGLQCY